VDGGRAVSAGIHRNPDWWTALRSIHPTRLQKTLSAGDPLTAQMRPSIINTENKNVPR